MKGTDVPGQDDDTANAILDPQKLGELLASARSYARYSSAEAAEEAMRREVGLVVPSGNIAAIEKGTATATFEQVCAMAYLYKVPGGVSYFLDALRQPIGAELKRAQWPFPRRQRKDG